MQEFWVKVGDRAAMPKGIFKILKVDESKGIKIRVIPECNLDEVRAIKGALVDPIRPRLKALVGGGE